MQRENKRFKAVRFKFETDVGGFLERYMIVDNHIPLFRVNQWLELKSIRKASTGQEYAKKMAIFLNWLDSRAYPLRTPQPSCTAIPALPDFRRLAGL